MDSKYPENIVDALENKHHFKLKRGCDFGRDKDGAMHFAPRKQIEKIKECCNSMFGSKPKNLYVTVGKGDHPKLDTSKCLDQHGT